MDIRSKTTIYITCKNNKDIDFEIIEPGYVYKVGESFKAIIPADYDKPFAPENTTQVELIVEKVEHSLIGLSGIMDQDIYITANMVTEDEQSK
jgi:hypothetical protein